MKTGPAILSGLMLAALLGGCRSAVHCALFPSSKYCGIENTEKFVLRDEAARAAIECTGLRERILPDGRFEVAANVCNRGEAPVKVRVGCVFWNELGNRTDGEVPCQTISLDGQETKVVTFVSPNDQARRYTVSVRTVR